MINTENAYFDELAIHHIGSKSHDEELGLSESTIDVGDQLQVILLRYFFNHFKSPEYFCLDVDQENQEGHHVFTHSSKLIEGSSTLFDYSTSIARHLFNQSNHPNIKSGDLLVAHVKDVLIDDEMIDAIVIVKSESKDDFIKILKSGSSFDLKTDQGIFVDKIDKVCVIFNTEKASGFKLAIADKSNNTTEAMYWKHDFLKAKPRNDDFHHTKDYIYATKSFIKDRLEPLYEMDKTDEAAILNRSKTFFKHEEDFESESYAKEVFQDDKVASLFEEYKADVRQEKNIPLADTFQVSQSAVKNYSKVFKSVIKLDKNFHIYVHGDRNLIERGTDDMGRKYYRIFYENEA